LKIVETIAEGSETTSKNLDATAESLKTATSKAPTLTTSFDADNNYIMFLIKQIATLVSYRQLVFYVG